MFKFLVVLFLTAGCIPSYAQDDKSNLDWANIKRYSKDNEMAGLPAKGEKRVVFMGNSITEFWKVFDSAFFVNKPYINRGISGQTTPQMLLRFRPDVINLKPSAVVILAGINDIAENNGPIPLEDVFGNIVSMVQLAQANHIEVVLCSVLPALDFYWHPGLHPAPKVIRLNTMLRDFCIKNHLVYVDYYSRMVDGNGGLNKQYSDDGVHPTRAGYAVMDPLVEEGIAKALKH